MISPNFILIQPQNPQERDIQGADEEKQAGGGSYKIGLCS